jgi:hypothetical protein
MGRPTDYTMAPNVGEAETRKPATFFDLDQRSWLGERSCGVSMRRECPNLALSTKRARHSFPAPTCAYS